MMNNKNCSRTSSIFPIKQFYFSAFIALFLVACVVVKEGGQQEQYLPNIINNIQLGLSMDKVLTLRPKAYVVNSLQETPRQVYTEDIESEEITSVYYLFEKTANKNLVEINLLYKSEAAAQQTINLYFGEQKNNKQNQWHKTLKDGTVVHATWVKQKIFIFVNQKDVNTTSEKAVEE